MGFLHHGNYFTYFEIGRTELLRASGGNYRQMEADGFLVVVVKAECRFRRPARYDDVLRLRTTITRVTQVKIRNREKPICGFVQQICPTLTAEDSFGLCVIDRSGGRRRWIRRQVVLGNRPPRCLCGAGTPE